MARVTHTLSDGTTISIRPQSTIIGTQLHEVASRKRPTGSLLWDDGRMYLLTSKGGMTRITHPDYEYAADVKAATTVALAFFVDSAEATIAHAAAEGIAVDDCY